MKNIIALEEDLRFLLARDEIKGSYKSRVLWPGMYYVYIWRRIRHGK